jgi:hypothetical protein
MKPPWLGTSLVIFQVCGLSALDRSTLVRKLIINTGSVSLAYDGAHRELTAAASVSVPASTTVPEPNSLILLGSGLLALFGVARKRTLRG